MSDTSLPWGPIGFGAFKIGRNTGTKYPNDYDLPDDRAVDRLLNEVLDLGIHLIDTAPAYGLSEERIGRAVGHRREECVLSTKVGETFEDGRSHHDFSADAVRRSIERSLTRLRTDVLDLVLVHAHHDDAVVLNETDAVSALRRAREAGLVREIGFSGYTEQAFRAALAWADAIMIEYNLENRTLEPVIAEATARSVRVLVKKGLASGTLPADNAVRFVLSHPGVTSLVIGSLNAAHLRDHLRTAAQVRATTARNV